MFALVSWAREVYKSQVLHRVETLDQLRLWRSEVSETGCHLGDAVKFFCVFTYVLCSTSAISIRQAPPCRCLQS